MQKEYLETTENLKVDCNKIVIIQSAWHQEITDNMVQLCQEQLVKLGADLSVVELVKVPGALEIPLTAKLIAKETKPSAIICFGAIIRGETYHFEMVANAVNEGMNKVAYEFEIPVIQQVLAVENIDQLKKRSSLDLFNKGIEAAQAAISMINLTAKY